MADQPDTVEVVWDPRTGKFESPVPPATEMLPRWIRFARALGYEPTGEAPATAEDQDAA